MDLYLNQQWEDSRLAYDVDIREGIDEGKIPILKIFSSNTFLTNLQ